MFLFWLATLAFLAHGKQEVLMQIYIDENSCETSDTPLYADVVELEFPKKLDDQVCVNEEDEVEGDDAASRPLGSTSFSCVEEDGISLIFVSHYATPGCDMNEVRALLYVESGKCFFDNRGGQEVWTRWTWQGFCGQDKKIDGETSDPIKVCSKKVLDDYQKQREAECEEDDDEGDGDVEDQCRCLSKIPFKFAEKANCYASEGDITSLQQQIFICKSFTSQVDYAPCDGLNRQECKAKREECLWYKAAEKCFDLASKCQQAGDKKECRNLDCYWARASERCYNSESSLCPEESKQSKCNKMAKCEWDRAEKRCCAQEFGCLD